MHDRHEGDHQAHGDSTLDLSVKTDRSEFGNPGDHGLRFRIIDAEGSTIRPFEETHERRMHLIVVRKDLSFFMHLHPTLDDDGSWRTEIEFPEPGPYTAFTDFATASSAVTLPFDLHVQGRYEHRPLEGPTEIIDADGYEVRLVRAPDEVTFRISESGKRVALAPYLGAMGHLVVLRADDLAFLHVHPMESDEEGVVRFKLHLGPGPVYKAFLQFIAGQAVHTAAFVIQP